MVPTLETHAQLIDGIRYDETNIVYIKSSPNNTLMTLTDYKGNILGLEPLLEVSVES